jgi:protein LSM14
VSAPASTSGLQTSSYSPQPETQSGVQDELQASAQPSATAANGGPKHGRAQQVPNGQGRDKSSASVRSAEASLDSVERALGDLRVSNQNQGRGHTTGGERRNRGRGGHQNIRGPGVVPETPFDFVRANAKFDKGALASTQVTESTPTSSVDLPTSPDSPPAPAFYNKTNSFFDDISSDAKSRSTGQTPGGPGVARSRREEERNKNMSTFGETGVHWNGGPSAGHGRRGGRRKYQGGSRGASNAQ